MARVVRHVPVADDRRMMFRPPEAPDPLRAPIGTREHVRRTLANARETLAAARTQHARSRSLLARAAALLDQGERVVQQSVALRAQLRASVTAYVHSLRAEQLPPQQVLVQVKSAVREATPPELDVVDARELMEDVVRWSIEAYYGAA
jgi:hypothetical protein